MESALIKSAAFLMPDFAPWMITSMLPVIAEGIFDGGPFSCFQAANFFPNREKVG
jgi:hypothetical protein